MNTLDKRILLLKLDERLTYLEGNTKHEIQTEKTAIDELRHWKETILLGLYDTQIWD